ncbi:MAG: hypothetical protein R2713_19250 [Ilumatobacteraceae bacterium]
MRGAGSYDTAIRAMDHLRDAGFAERNGPFKISVVVTRHNVDQLGRVQGARRQLRRSCASPAWRPSGRGADTWHELHPTNAQQRQIYDWLMRQRRAGAHRRLVLPPQRARRTAAWAQHVRSGSRVCLIDPIGDVYACPFVIHDEFKAGRARMPWWLHRGVEAQRALHRTCASRSRPGPAPAVAAGTPARAVRWQRSSSLGRRRRLRDPECVGGAAGWRCRRSTSSSPRGPAMDHSKPVTLPASSILVAGNRRAGPTATRRTPDLGNRLRTVRTMVGTGADRHLLGTFPSAVMVARSKGADITGRPAQPGCIERRPHPRHGVGRSCSVLDGLKGDPACCRPRRRAERDLRAGGRRRARPHVRVTAGLSAASGHRRRRDGRAAPRGLPRLAIWVAGPQAVGQGASLGSLDRPAADRRRTRQQPGGGGGHHGARCTRPAAPQ